MEKSPSNTYLALVFNHEKESFIRAANQFVFKKLSFKIKQKIKEKTIGKLG